MEYQITFERCFVDKEGKVKWVKENFVEEAGYVLGMLRTMRETASWYELRLIRKSKGTWVEIQKEVKGITGIFRTIKIEPIKE